jgi:hypothetical protein
MRRSTGSCSGPPSPKWLGIIASICPRLLWLRTDSGPVCDAPEQPGAGGLQAVGGIERAWLLVETAGGVAPGSVDLKATHAYGAE